MNYFTKISNKCILYLELEKELIVKSKNWNSFKQKHKGNSLLTLYFFLSKLIIGEFLDTLNISIKKAFAKTIKKTFNEILWEIKELKWGNNYILDYKSSNRCKLV